MGIKDYLPDFKGALKGFYEENLKEAIETKTAYYESLLKENIAFSQRTQKIAIALGIGAFLLLTIVYFCPDNYKYLSLGVLLGYLIPYLFHLIKAQQETN